VSQLFGIESERLKLPAPFGRWIAERLEKIPQPGNFNDMFSRQNSGD
jgi:hypothetical protein